MDAKFEDEIDFQFDREVNARNLVNASEAAADGISVIGSKDDAKKPAGDDLFATEQADAGVQFMAVRPYIGALVAPSNVPANNPEMPQQQLVLDWVYGYRGYDSRANICWNSKRELVYPSAAVVVSYDAGKHKQRHFQGHNDDVICLAQHPKNPDIIATGQVATIVNRRATAPHICVFNSVSGQSWVLKDAHKRAVRTLAFSPDGKFLASVGDDDNQTVTIWDWETTAKVASMSGDTNKILQVRWNHKAPNEFVTVGLRHVFFWTFDGKELKKSRGKLGNSPASNFTAIAFSEKGFACVGADNGTIMAFVNGECKKTFQVHNGPVLALEYYPGGLVSGGKDGKVVVLDATVAPCNTIDMGAPVRAVYVGGADLLVSTQKCEISEVKDFLKSTQASAPLVQGHWDGELWGVSVSPDGKSFATAGDDNTLAVWDISSRKKLRQCPINEKAGPVLKGGPKASTTGRHPPNQCARAVEWSPDGKQLAVGTNAGELRVFDSASLKLIVSVDLNDFGKRQIKGQQENWIQTLRYSPNGQLIAVGTHGMVICLVDLRDNFKVKGLLKAHNAPITHLDWTADGAHLQSNCRGYELLFHDVDQAAVDKCKQNSFPKSLRDAKWASRTCILGWPVNGVFDPQQDGTDVNIVDVAPSQQFLATGDDYGYVNLFRYPCNVPGNKRRVYTGHSSHVANLRFSPNEKYLISVGGNDKTVLQWKVV